MRALEAFLIVVASMVVAEITVHYILKKIDPKAA
jgi:hypothetical protein